MAVKSGIVDPKHAVWDVAIVAVGSAITVTSTVTGRPWHPFASVSITLTV